MAKSGNAPGRGTTDVLLKVTLRSSAKTEFGKTPVLPKTTYAILVADDTDNVCRPVKSAGIVKAAELRRVFEESKACRNRLSRSASKSPRATETAETLAKEKSARNELLLVNGTPQISLVDAPQGH